MSRLSDLIRQAKAADSQLGADLEREFRALTKRRSFGLVFERHQPEAVELAGRTVRKGDKVRVLPPRGSRSRGDQRLWTVTGFEGRGEKRVVKLIEAAQVDAPEAGTALVADLVVVAEFRDHIYPGLVETGRVEHGGNKPFHTVINAENYHALEMLTYTHRHAIDAIYIDPPYNTGAKDWKYNNDYVEADDDYRHSKWLAMMERRLLIARELLNPDDSVLIVTIDEKEYLRLGLLLEQVFPEANIQMVTTCIKPSGSQRADEFSRVEEYVFFVMFGDARPTSSLSDMLRDPVGGVEEATVTWHGLRRRGSTDWRRSHRPNGFYPLFIDSSGSLHSVGEPIPAAQDRSEVDAPDGTWAAWPLDPSGEEGRWQISPARLREQLEEGTAALRTADRSSGSCSVIYLKSGDLRRIRDGVFETDGRDAEGKLNIVPTRTPSRRAKTMWLMPSHDASTHGTALLSKFVPGTGFPFPKSLYAVEDTLRFFVGTKPDAVILDYFAGSGTTTHAAMKLNRQDGGRRQCIAVTNNEVAASEQSRLRREGLRPGDPDWESLGICDYITKPRITSAITGKTPDGEPIRGEYKFTDEFPMSEGFNENAAFFTLTYEGPLSAAHHRAFARIAPMLWLRAGARGPLITEIGDKGWDLTHVYGVLDDLDTAARFVTEVKATPGVTMAYIVTDDDLAFQMVCRELPKGVRPVQLYESYLRNFEINSGRFA